MPQTSDQRLAVIGAGPAGLAAAIAAARSGARVSVFERNGQPGWKLLVTGGGHCNAGNHRPVSEWPALFGKHGRFVAPALNHFPKTALLDFFQEIGQPLVSPDNFHLFPASQSARQVRDALVARAINFGVDLVGKHRVERLEAIPSGLAVDGTAFTAVILATGGHSYPETGSTWDGCRLAAGLGHRVQPPTPGLVGLRCEDLDPELAGLVMPDSRVRGRIARQGELQGRGELLLTHRGLSGPAVLDMSTALAEELSRSGTELEIHVEWIGGRGAMEWRDQLTAWRSRSGGREISSLLREFFPARLAAWLSARAGVEAIAAARLTAEGRDRLAQVLGAYPVRVTGTEGWERAIITRGGVDVREVEAGSMASKLVPGLFFAGEMLGVDGPCGGYNLHWAFASGTLAGKSAAGI